MLLAVGLDHAMEKFKLAPWLLAASTMSLIALPTVVNVLPSAMLSGVGRTQISPVLMIPFVLVAILFSSVVWWLSWSGKPSLAMIAAGMAVVFGVAYFKGAAFPELDDRVSVRGFWRTHQAEGACLEGVPRAWEYGLNYYASHALHACAADETPRIAVVDGRLKLIASD